MPTTGVYRSCTEKCTEVDSFTARAYLCTKVNMNQNCLPLCRTGSGKGATKMTWVNTAFKGDLINKAKNKETVEVTQAHH